jgi:acetylglutamate kinase
MSVKNNHIDKPESDSSSSPGGEGRDGALFVVKIGGNVLDDETNLSTFLKDFSTIEGLKILVHGGGKIATKIGEKLGIESQYINGRRITDDEVIDVVTMVYGGLLNKKIVAQLQATGCNAIGLTGADGNIIPAIKRAVKEIDYGWVGDIESSKIKSERLKILLDAGFVPVFAPLTHDEQGHILNINADTIASSLAVALSAFYTVRLIYCFEKKGVLADVNDDNSVITQINKHRYKNLLDEKKLFAGILPKIDNAFAAIDAGVKEVLIGDAKDLMQNVTDQINGTLFTS